ncbi:hypothetical protein D0C16_03515 [Cellvibrio sp. KY-GH-1]|uniref:hypothetical protein n=1 Tax=Cellvibrio sp. KY-GH-1 TaxID=2303332 RepID=UPI00124407ED|nr:hypothetical protein [Cellvibrio sp. KY-GH-1]QEY15117.1 hypothetical protein D0C16_03515 [Cellvibrio sp. KY-GH-1]
MVTRKPLYYFVIALCLWLPLQAIAGQWVHCAQLQSSMMDKNPSLISHSTDAPCHQVDQKKLHSMDDNAHSGKDIKSCKHCQFMCHWHCVLLVNNLLDQNIELTPHYTAFTLPSPMQPLLALPQKPPQTRA